MSEDATTKRFGDAVREFERLIDRGDVSVTADENDLIAEFESIAKRYGTVRSDLTDLKAELPTDEDGGFTAEVFDAEGPIERWRDRHPEHVTEIGQLFEDYQAVFDQVDIEDPDTNPAEDSDSEIGGLMKGIVFWKTIFDPADE